METVIGTYLSDKGRGIHSINVQPFLMDHYGGVHHPSLVYRSCMTPIRERCTVQSFLGPVGTRSPHVNRRKRAPTKKPNAFKNDCFRYLRRNSPVIDPKRVKQGALHKVTDRPEGRIAEELVKARPTACSAAACNEDANFLQAKGLLLSEQHRIRAPRGGKEFWTIKMDSSKQKTIEHRKARTKEIDGIRFVCSSGHDGISGKESIVSKTGLPDGTSDPASNSHLLKGAVDCIETLRHQQPRQS
ncbi:hypothetical protein CVT26_014377 [Gymnopilus dilepis]|uniref:Uncharacterized protein n=1 Tax=Gymnopilus dilepis TaxID=231916 RepID=A0A409WTQ3_9AGAR|nr:hypothetical protein CVT26_014377 [Gymnopilus dilepis]